MINELEITMNKVTLSGNMETMIPMNAEIIKDKELQVEQHQDHAAAIVSWREAMEDPLLSHPCHSVICSNNNATSSSSSSSSSSSLPVKSRLLNNSSIEEFFTSSLTNIINAEKKLMLGKEKEKMTMTWDFGIIKGSLNGRQTIDNRTSSIRGNNDVNAIIAGIDVQLLDDGENGCIVDDESDDHLRRLSQQGMADADADALNCSLANGVIQQFSQDDDVSCGGDRVKLAGVCKVCGDHATGMYFGALVCVPCKTFFLRYASDGNSFVCKADGSCQISTSTRTQCKYCRYQKCVQAGMRRRVRPVQVKLNEGQQLCVVCSDVGNGVHFGALTCEGCKKFFRRGLTENSSYTCKSNNNCVINPQTRNSCRYCRYQKCLRAGMCREAIQMGRPSKIPSGSNRNLVDKHLLLCPLGKSIDSSGGRDAAADILVNSRCQTDNLITTQGTNLQNSSDNWINTVFGHSFLTPKNSRSLSSSSEESQVDVENSDDHYKTKGTSPHPSSSSSDFTQQPDSTVLSPAEVNQLDEQEELLLSADNLLCPRSVLKAKGQLLLQNEVRINLGKRQVPSGNDNMLHDKQRRTSSGAETEGVSLRTDRLPMRLHNGGKISGRSRSDLIAETKQLNSTLISFGQGVATSSTILPLLKENSSNRKVQDRHLKVPVSLDSSSTDQASGSCSSPSITSSFAWDQKKTQSHDETINSSENQALQNEDSSQREATPKKFDIESLVGYSRTYWLQPCLPDPNILFAGAKHWDVLNSIVPAYDRFLQMSNTINRTLKADFEEWSKQLTDPADNQAFLSEWIKQKVIPAYTIASVTYCKSLPGFSSFHCDDQITIIRLGQSPSRILMAALNWYDADQKNFRNFLSWRDKKVGQLDLFKQKLIEYAEDITSLEVDAIEAALLNVLLILATDYPDLVRADIINDARWKILSTFRAYTTGKCGTPNNRVESLFSHIPELRRLGLLHHMMMTTRTMTAEEVEYLTSGRILDSKMVLSCQQITDSS